MPVNPIGGSVETTTTTDGHTLLRADNAERYTPYLRLMEQASTQKLVQTYVHFYPLFQKAYQDLGYPKGYFNDRLIEVISARLPVSPELFPPEQRTDRSEDFHISETIREKLTMELVEEVPYGIAGMS
jgi:GTPase Era involved in 16S rRNA processing